MALKNLLLLFVTILLVATMVSAQDDDFDEDLKITKPKTPKSPPPKPKSPKKQPQPKPKSAPPQRRTNKLPPLPKPSLEEPYNSPIHDDFDDETPSLAVANLTSHQEDQKLKIPRGASGLMKGFLNNPAAPSSGRDHSNTHPTNGTNQ